MTDIIITWLNTEVDLSHVNKNHYILENYRRAL